MAYLKLFFYNFLIVFFANYLLPGIETINPTKLPHINGDCWFAIGVGLLNSLIFPVMKVLDQPATLSRIAIAALAISFVSYTIMKFAPLGIEIKNIQGYFIAMLIVAIGGFATSFWEMKRSSKFPKLPDMPRM